MSDVCRYFGAQWNGVVKSSPLESDNQEAGSLLTLRRYSQPAPNIHSLKCTFGKKKKKKKIQDLPLLILKTPDRKNFLSRCTHTRTYILGTFLQEFLKNFRKWIWSWWLLPKAAVFSSPRTMIYLEVLPFQGGLTTEPLPPFRPLFSSFSSSYPLTTSPSQKTNFLEFPLGVPQPG